jgi:hypothetical protein
MFNLALPPLDLTSQDVGTDMGRVEYWPPAGRSGLSVPAPFVWRCLTSPTVRDLQHPLIEPDVRFSRIRLSEHLHREADAGAWYGAPGSR